MTQHRPTDSGLQQPPRGSPSGPVPIEGQPAERVRFHVGVRRSSAGGRPALPSERRRSIVVSVRLSPAEFERAFNLAHAHGARNVRAFLRAAVLEFAAQPEPPRPPRAG